MREAGGGASEEVRGVREQGGIWFGGGGSYGLYGKFGKTSLACHPREPPCYMPSCPCPPSPRC